MYTYLHSYRLYDFGGSKLSVTLVSQFELSDTGYDTDMVCVCFPTVSCQQLVVFTVHNIEHHNIREAGASTVLNRLISILINALKVIGNLYNIYADLEYTSLLMETIISRCFMHFTSNKRAFKRHWHGTFLTVLSTIRV